MRIQLSSAALRRLTPASPGISAHCHRVAALSLETAHRLPLSWRGLATLEQAALLHHTPPVQFTGQDELPADLEAVLRLFHGADRVTGERVPGMLAGILTLADALDQQMESLAWEPRGEDVLWDELAPLSGLAGEAVWKAAQEALRRPHRLSERHHWDLPVHASVVKEVANALRANPDCDPTFLAQLAARDPVLAGNVLATANSAWFGRRTRVRSVSQAISYIGADAARRLLLALALKPLYGSARLAALWRHSVAMAGLCESLAATTGFLPPGEALTLGLVHDIGRVALLRHPATAGGSAFARLLGRQCPPLYAEQMIFGQSHEEIGAGILEGWDFAPDLVAAVRAHHHPADCDSPSAAALYLAEFWTATDEDLPSARHLDAAQRRLGCSIEMLAHADRGPHPLAHLLRVA